MSPLALFTFFMQVLLKVKNLWSKLKAMPQTTTVTKPLPLKKTTIIKIGDSMRLNKLPTSHYTPMRRSIATKDIRA
ncbi:hypothetical protein Lal_00000728 [Lupinus albus]|nr:hypothetical protein Lal_00000728 [Lupinus albus]